MISQNLIKYRFYLGENNKTHKRELQKAINIFNSFKVIGFNLLPSVVGYWENQKEKSFIFEVITEEKNLNDIKVREIKTELEKRLKQYLVFTTREEIKVLN